MESAKVTDMEMAPDNELRASKLMSSSCPSKELLARRKRMEIRRLKMIAPDCHEISRKRSRFHDKSNVTLDKEEFHERCVEDVERVATSPFLNLTSTNPNSELKLAAIITAVTFGSDAPANRESTNTTCQASDVASVKGNAILMKAGTVVLSRKDISIGKQSETCNGKCESDFRCNGNSGGLSECNLRNNDEQERKEGSAKNEEDSATYFLIDEKRSRKKFATDALCPPHGLISVIGRRREMEDAAAAVPYLCTLPVDQETTPTSSADKKQGFLHFYGVYDGHGGPQAAVYCKERCHGILVEELMATQRTCKEQSPSVATTGSSIQWQKIMASCFLRLDAEIGGFCSKGVDCQKANGNLRCCSEPVAPETVGTTAVVAVVTPEQIIVANCGDSRAVISRGGKAIALSQDHKPERPDEMERIEAAGGRIVVWNGSRVLGVLAMSRAIGDRYLKPFVIADPEVTCMDRSEHDECLILASDGLWDKLSTEDVCNVTRRCLAGQRFSKHMYGEDNQESPAEIAAAILTKLALSRGSTDNISVVVVDLKRKVALSHKI